MSAVQVADTDRHYGRIGWPRAVPADSVSQEIMLDVRDRRPHPGAK
jgi:hypothetical protein